jgi:hypothetical protein
MPVIYQDNQIICDDEALTILHYYFPLGSKRIPYTAIKKIEDYQMGLLTGKLRIWGTSLPTYWFHFDLSRPLKTFAIIVDTGDIVKPVITPDNHDLVFDLLRDRVKPKLYLKAVNG